MKKLIFLTMLLGILLLTASCGSDSVTTTPTTSIWDSPATVATPLESTAKTADTTTLPHTTVITEPKLVVVYPESYEAISISAASCKSGVSYNYASQYDATETLENCKVVFGSDMPRALRESGLNQASSKAEFVAHAQKVLLAYVGGDFGADTLLVNRQSEQKGSYTFYDFVFHRGDLQAPRAVVSIRSDGLVSSLDIYKELYLERFGKIDLNSAALTEVVNALQHKNQTKKTTSVIMGKTHLYLVVNIDHETYAVDFDEEGNPFTILDDQGNAVVVEHLSNTYYILLAEIIPENEVNTYGVKSEAVRVDTCGDSVEWLSSFAKDENAERPLICFDSQETLDGFVTAFKEKYFNGEFTMYDVKGFAQKLSKYNETFFAKKSLILIGIMDMETGSAVYSLDDMLGKEQLTLVLKRTLQENITHDMGFWFMLVEIDKVRLQDVSALDATVKTEIVLYD